MFLVLWPIAVFAFYLRGKSWPRSLLYGTLLTVAAWTVFFGGLELVDALMSR